MAMANASKGANYVATISLHRRSWASFLLCLHPEILPGNLSRSVDCHAAWLYANSGGFRNRYLYESLSRAARFCGALSTANKLYQPQALLELVFARKSAAGQRR